MEDLTQYFDLLVPVALVLLFLFQRMFARDEGEGPPQPPSEADETARRIREEIRRKIVARQQGRAEPPPASEAEVWPPGVPRSRPAPDPHEVPPPFRDVWEPEPLVVEESPPPRWESPSIQAEAGRPADDLELQLREQKRRLEEARRAKALALEQSRAKGLAGSKGRSGKGGRRRRDGNLRGALLADLSGRENLQRAFVLKEVLDRPVGTRSDLL